MPMDDASPPNSSSVDPDDTLLTSSIERAHEELVRS